MKQENKGTFHVFSLCLLVIGVLYLVCSIWLAFWKPTNKDDIFLSHPIAIILISIALIYLKLRDNFKEWFIQKPIRFYWISMIVVTVILIPLGLFSGIKYKEDVLVEAHGLLFDLFVFGIVLSFYEAIKTQYDNEKKEENNRKQRIERHEEQIDYLKHWKSEEAKFIIRGHIRSLNKEEITKINLSDVDISSDNYQKIRIEDLKLDDSELFRTNLSNLTLYKSSFNGIVDSHNSEFINTFLVEAKFKGCILQGTIFDLAELSGADFTGSDILGASFREAALHGTKFIDTYFSDDTDFERAKVNSDFFDKVKEWNVRNDGVFKRYRLAPFNDGTGKGILTTDPNVMDAIEYK